MRTFFALTIFMLASTAFSQAPVPTGQAPKIGLASATEKDGKVIIKIWELREVVRMKTGNGNDVFVEQRHWLELTAGTLGKDIRAFRPDGKQATEKEVLAALTKSRGVTYFLGHSKANPIQPDPFYLGLLKEGTVALAFDRPELAIPMP